MGLTAQLDLWAATLAAAILTAVIVTIAIRVGRHGEVSAVGSPTC